MAIEKTLKTRIVQKIDDLNSWKSSSLPLKKGEIALATTTINGKNIVLAKIGVDDIKTWNQIPEYNFYAPAADVSPWAKSGTVKFIENGENHQLAFGNLAENGEFVTVATIDAKIFVTHTELEEELNERFDGLTTISASGALKAVEENNNKDIQHKTTAELKTLATGKEDKTTTNYTGNDKTSVIKAVIRDEYGHVIGVENGTIAQDKTTVSITDDGCCIEVEPGTNSPVVTTDNATGVTTTAYSFNIKHVDKLDKEYNSTEKDENDENILIETHQGTPGGTVQFEVPRFKTDTCGHIEEVYGETVKIVLPDETISFDADGEGAADTNGLVTVIKNITTVQPTEENTDPDHTLHRETIANVTTKTYVDKEIASLRTEVPNLVPAIPSITITDDSTKGTDSADLIYVINDLDASGHAITQKFKAVPTKDYVDKKVAGGVDYIGTIGTGGSTTTLSTTCGKGDFYRVITADAGKTGTHPGDLLIAEKDNPSSAADWSIIHGEEGDITSVVGGNGLTGSGESGQVTLNVGDGKGIAVSDNKVEADIGNGLEFSDTTDAAKIKVKAANTGITVTAEGVGHKLKDQVLKDVTPSDKKFINAISFDEYGHVESVTTDSVQDINTTYTTNLKAIKNNEGETISVDVELVDNNNNVASKFNIAEAASGNIQFTVTESDENGKDVLTIDAHDSLYELDTNPDQSNGNVKINLLKDDGTTADSSVSIKGTGATTVKTDTNGVIVVNSTDNNTTYDLATESNTTEGTIKLVGSDNTDDKIHVKGVTNHTSVSSDNSGNITIDAAESKNIVAGSTTATANAADTTGTETADDLTTPNVAAVKSKYKKYDLYLNHVETLDTTNNVTSTHKISAINGLKVTSDTNGNMEFGIDDDIVFVFDCGDASSY